MNSSDGELSRTNRVLESGLRRGYHTRAGVVVQCAGRTLRAAVGGPISDGNEQLEPLYPLFCAAKPLLSLAVALLVERGDLAYDDPIADLIPDFGRCGKAEVRIRDVLLHTTGFRKDPASSHVGQLWPDIVDAICGASLEAGWSPGQQACYQPFSYWYLVGELLMNATGQPLGRLIRSLILTPFGLSNTWLGMTQNEYSGNAPRLVRLVSTRYEGPDAALTPLSAGPNYPNDLSSENVCCAHADYSSRGSLSDLARMYGILADRETSAALIPVRARDDVITRRRRGMLDHFCGLIIDVGFGMSFESRMYGTPSQRYGKWANEQSFGHAGGFSVDAFADPIAGIAAAWGVDGSAGPLRNLHRAQAIFTAIYEDLGIALSG